MLSARLATAAVGISLLVAVFSLGRWGMLILALVIGVGSAVELDRLLKPTGLGSTPVLGAVFVVAAQIAAWRVAPDQAGAFAAQVLLGIWLSVILLFTVRFASVRRKKAPGTVVGSFAGSLFSAAYIAWPLSLWPALFQLGEAGGRMGGPAFAAFPLVIPWVSDAAAYFVGRGWGRRPLAPHVSPAKTLEGSLAGLLGGTLAAGAMSQVLPWSLGTSLAIGLLAGGVGQVGDLWESVLKRAAGRKDSGSLFPGHGGFLDRFDALFFALPVTYVAALMLR